MNQTMQKIHAMMRKHSKGLELRTTTIGSKAPPQENALYLYGKKEVSIGGRAPQQTYVVGVIERKNCPVVYLMPLYSHPAQLQLSEEMQAMVKGKSCIHILDEKVLAELERAIARGIELYKKEGWI